MEALIKPAVFLILVVIGYFRGRHHERAHLLALAEEELALKDVLIFATRYPDMSAERSDPVLVSGSAVVSSDYFRFLLANLRKFLGGSYAAYENLNERARRQAIVRMKQEARKHKADMIFNMRVNTSRISHPREGGTPQVEVHVYGTALVPAQGSIADSAVHFRASDYPVPAEAKNAIRHPVSLACIAALLALIFYSVLDMATDSTHLHHWRYINGAPWLAYLLLSASISGGIALFARKKKVPVAESIALPLMLVPALCFSLYFLVIRCTGLLPDTISSATFTIRENGLLIPAPTSGLPVMDPGDYRDYWQSKTAGTTVDITIMRSVAGIFLYDIAPLRNDFRRFYDEQDNRRRTKERGNHP